jgi:hypothetical protein
MSELGFLLVEGELLCRSLETCDGLGVRTASRGSSVISKKSTDAKLQNVRSAAVESHGSQELGEKTLVAMDPWLLTSRWLILASPTRRSMSPAFLRERARGG